MNKYWSWMVWGLLSITLVGFFSWNLFLEGDKSMYLIGTTTDGHHQIELECDSCHLEPFGGADLIQEACENCHLDELKSVRDSHPMRKFTDPSNADRVALLDARFCVTCHREHKEGITTEMGVTVPEDVCFVCHEGIGEERNTHKGMAFDTCGNSGCHNFHDNTALYENFLVENANQPDLLNSALVAPLNALEVALLASNKDEISLELDGIDAPQDHSSIQSINNQWADSAHAIAGVNCSGCHNDEENQWQDSVSLEQCGSCHSQQNEGFMAGKHGMRISLGLSPMTPAMARLEMRDDSHAEQLSCTSCHQSHDFNLQLAAVEACLDCHNSEHALGYKNSRHGQLTQLAFNQKAPLESAVTCATCHMPRVITRSSGQDVTHVEHNQNLNLRPNDKMLRSVCMTCHSLAFSIDALAEQTLIDNNFSSRPTIHIESIDMAVQRRESASNKDSTYR